IVSIVRIHQSKHASVAAGCTRHLPPFAHVNVHLWRRNLVRRTRFYFYKTECRPIVSDQIDFGIDDRIADVAPNRQTKIRGHNSIAGPLEVLERQGLAVLAQFKMRWPRRDRFSGQIVAFKIQRRLRPPSSFGLSSLPRVRQHSRALPLCSSWAGASRMCPAKSFLVLNVDLLCPFICSFSSGQYHLRQRVESGYPIHLRGWY